MIPSAISRMPQAMNDEPVTNDSDNPCFEQLLAVLSAHGKARRRLLQFGIGSAALPFLGWPALAAPVARPGIGFRPVAAIQRRCRTCSRGVHAASTVRLG
jgi:hypothetical protein